MPGASDSRYAFEIQGDWQGGALVADEFARVELVLGPTPSEPIRIRVEASDHGDPPPESPAARLPGLWEHEVVELFLLGREEEYLEIELGPHGHWLGLRLVGRRRIVEDRVPIEFAAVRREGRWWGEARIEGRFLPPGLRAANLYAIHGRGAKRRFLAAHPVPGDGPDFHRLEHFTALDPIPWP